MKTKEEKLQSPRRTGVTRVFVYLWAIRGVTSGRTTTLDVKVLHPLHAWSRHYISTQYLHGEHYITPRLRGQESRYLFFCFCIFAHPVCSALGDLAASVLLDHDRRDDPLPHPLIRILIRPWDTRVVEDVVDHHPVLVEGPIRFVFLHLREGLLDRLVRPRPHPRGLGFAGHHLRVLFLHVVGWPWLLRLGHGMQILRA